ncbi:MAG TPA: MoaD/ThiS family protein [Gammaproteobacteria bacterium]|nr:MoaD/ThiS family protein [Gammaproteobacteria bacterium]
MTISVKYFASLRERLGRADDRIDAGTVHTVADVWTRVSAGLPLPDNILMAVNLEYAQAGQAVKDGDEVAFFPPVTGG